MKRYKVITFFALFLFGITSWVGYKLYKDTFGNIANQTTYVFIPKGSNIADVIDILDDSGLITNKELFLFLAKQKKFDENRVIGGRYEIYPNTNLNALIDQLKIGDTCPITVKLKKFDSLDAVATTISKHLEITKEEFLTAFTDSNFILASGFTPETFPAIFIPGDYEFFWEWSAESLRNKFVDQYHIFWNEKRLKKAKRLNLSPIEVHTLASIVNKETYLTSELSTIAGLYYNRIRKKMYLQSDPTIIYTIHQKEPNRKIRRVLYRDLKIDSPYNTYLNKGLPPGPISYPKPSVIDATLNLERHNYIFMCAQSNLGGTHAFAETAEEHELNANSYREALDSLRVRR
ncbi:MAG: endolytic transglycosylase MltG [Flavobacteriales bacterium]